jgi:hypothetical protein
MALWGGRCINTGSESVETIYEARIARLVGREDPEASTHTSQPVTGWLTISLCLPQDMKPRWSVSGIGDGYIHYTNSNYIPSMKKLSHLQQGGRIEQYAEDRRHLRLRESDTVRMKSSLNSVYIVSSDDAVISKARGLTEK